MRKHMIAASLVLAGFTSGCATPSSAPAQPEVQYDQSQNAAVAQIPVLSQGQQVGVVVLQKGRFHCEEGWARAILVSIRQAIWVGCWQRKDGKLTARFEDGDELSVKVNEQET